jgi:hypothetical protein
MMVFVRGADNLQFANPTVGNYDLTPFNIQSEEYSQKSDVQHMEMGEATNDESSHRALVNFGEAVYSLRTLLRRTNLLDTVDVPPSTANTAGVYRITQTRFPPYYGYDPEGWNVIKGITNPSFNYAFNLVHVTPWHLISNCFIAQRGSINWTFNPTKASNGLVSRVMRFNYTFPGYDKGYYSGLITNSNIASYSSFANTTATNAGASLTHTSTTNGHSIVAPSFSPFKFQTTDFRATTDPGNISSPKYDGTVNDSLVIEYPYNSAHSPSDGMVVERYFGVGADYSLHFFLCCPSLNYLSPTSLVPV